MEIEKLLECIGEPISSQQLVKILLENGIDLLSELVLPDGDYRAYIERPAEGHSLVFTDEAVFLGRANQVIGKGMLYLSGVFLYAEGKDGYSQFKGNLPMGLSFSIDIKDIGKKLGSPSWVRKREDGSIAAERWDNAADYRIHFSYSKSTSRPVLVSLNMADKQ